MRWAPLWSLVLAGCPWVGDEGVDRYQDADGDGVLAERFGGRDCDDADASVGDCDADGDGHRSLQVEGGDDCDDDDPAVNPERPEICNGADDDCDGLVDDADAPVVGQQGWFIDVDADGYGTGTPLMRCVQPQDSSAFGGDCDDSEPGINPGVEERCDAIDWNCDGDPSADARREWFVDADGDGFGAPGSPVATTCERPAGDVAPNPFDCDDTDPDAHPADPITGIDDEVCDGIDNDCDGLVDDEDVVQDPDAVVRYVDADGDGFGDITTARPTCVGAGLVDNALDCDDTNALARPGVPPALSQVEICDGFDNDCDGLFDADDPSLDPGSAVLGYPDADGDGFGDGSAPAAVVCDAAVTNATDCDDGDPAINPSASERCDTPQDDDCDGLQNSNDPDNDGSIVWYLDLDLDGVGSGGDPVPVCDANGRQGASPVPGDCNDQDATVTADVAWYLDEDGDGFGEDADVLFSCFPLPNRSRAGGDCDPFVAANHPGAAEQCDGFDNDCDGTIDDGAPGAVYGFVDADGDGFGDGADGIGLFCALTIDVVLDGTDCDDSDPGTNPLAPEDCDPVDRNCNGLDGEDDPAIVPYAWYADDDLDGFGAIGAPALEQCDAPLGFVRNAADCDDTDPTRYFASFLVAAQPGGPFVADLSGLLAHPARCETTTVVLDSAQPFFVDSDASLVATDTLRVVGEDPSAVVCWDPDAVVSIAGALALENVAVVFGTRGASAQCIPAASLVSDAPMRLVGGAVSLDGVQVADADLAGSLVDGVGSVELLRSDFFALSFGGGLVELSDAGSVVLEQVGLDGIVAAEALVRVGGAAGVRIEETTVAGGLLEGLVHTTGPADVEVRRLAVYTTGSDAPLFCANRSSCAAGADDAPGGSLALRVSAFDEVHTSGGEATPLAVMGAEPLITEDLRVRNTATTGDPLVAFEAPGAGGWSSLRDRFVGPTGGVASSGREHTFQSAHLTGSFVVDDPTGMLGATGVALVGGTWDLRVQQARIDGLVLGDAALSTGSVGALVGDGDRDLYRLPGAPMPAACAQLACVDMPTASLVTWSPGLPPERMIPYPRGTQPQGLDEDPDLAYGGVPWALDPNGDGLPVAWLMLQAAEPECWAHGAALFDDVDLDADDWTNVQEAAAGTWPCIDDTDDDSVPDGFDPSPLTP
ncbi:MAG: putative metal-binding motif-containing protein [Alphaproteobacteria bacterium]|nr:putative metal-binding motif-containing protein [Alphaproteobacteria bacterium]